MPASHRSRKHNAQFVFPAFGVLAYPALYPAHISTPHSSPPNPTLPSLQRLSKQGDGRNPIPWLLQNAKEDKEKESENKPKAGQTKLSTFFTKPQAPPSSPSIFPPNRIMKDRKT